MTPRLDALLGRWRRERLAALLAPALTRGLAAAGALALGAALADRLVPLPLPLRRALFAAGAAAGAAAAARWSLRLRRELEAGRVLEEAAARWPGGRGLLRSGWELARCAPLPGTSAALAARHVADAEAAAAGLPDERLYPAGLESGLRRKAASCAAAWVLAWPLVGAGGARRVLAPWAETPLEADVAVLPGDAKVPWGSRGEVTAAWRPGARGGPLELEVRVAAGRWEPAPWEPGGEPRAFRTGPLTAPFEYRLRSRDRTSRAWVLSPEAPPRFTRVVARLERPGAEPAEVRLDGASELAAARGSWVLVRAFSDRPADKAWLEAPGLGAPAAMRRAEDGVWEAGFPLRQDGVMKASPERGGLREADPPAWQVRALDDKAPEVSLLSPAFPVEISPRERLKVAFEARDDHGLSALALVVRADGGPERALALPAPRGGAAAHLGEYDWDLSPFPAGTRLEFRVRASDDSRPRPQDGYSQAGLAVLTDFDGQHRAVEASWLAAQARVEALAEAEARLAKALEESRGAPEAERAGRAAALEQADRDLARTWDEAAKSLAALASGMEKDPYANPGMTETARALSDGVERLRREDLPAARQAQKAGDLAEAARRHAELAERVRKAGSLLEAGRELQSMQDFWAETQRMEAAGQDLAQSLKALAKGAPGPEERRRLEKAMADIKRRMAELAKAVEGLPKKDPGSEADRRRRVYKVPLNAAKGAMDALEAAMARGDWAEAARQAEELSRRLKAVQEAVARAARDMAEDADESPTARLGQLEAAWKEAADAQERALQGVGALDDARLAERTRAQEELLKTLAAEQRAAVKEGERLGRWMPPGALPEMRQALAELEGRQVKDTAGRMERAAERLARQAAALTPAEGQRPQAASDLEALAAAERDLARRLREGSKPPPPTEEQAAQARAAGAVQRQAGKRASELGPMMDGLEKDFGVGMGTARGELSQARAAQGEAEEALGRGDTSGAQAAQRRALEHLRKGGDEAGRGRQEAQGRQQAASRPFGMPRSVARPMGRGGRTGADTGFVPMPGVQEYQPPKVIRGEVEKSLQEKRPSAFDKAVDEYLRRLSQ